MKEVRLIPVVHRDEKRLLVKFAYDAGLISIIKKVSGAKFSATHKSWHVPDNKDTQDVLLSLFSGKSVIHSEELYATNRNDNINFENYLEI